MGSKQKWGKKKKIKVEVDKVSTDMICKKRRRLCCVNPAPWPPLAAGSEFTQPSFHLFLQFCGEVKDPFYNTHTKEEKERGRVQTQDTRKPIKIR